MSELKCNPYDHKKHMCQLRQEGQMEEIDKHSAHPTVQCNRCQAKADDASYLCQPRELAKK